MMKALFPILSILLFVQFAPAQDKKPYKLTLNEVISKHLASIGKPEDLAAVKSRVMIGTGKVSSKLGFDGTLNGTAQFASEGDKVLFAMIFGSSNYPYEKAAFDGKDQSVGYPNGIKTYLASFLRAQGGVLKQGLFGGVLSSAWPLLDVKRNKAKVSYVGTVELNGKQTHKLKYSSGVGDMTVSLFFDAENFHHVRTEYRYTVEAQQGVNALASATQKPDYYVMEEDFGDYKTADKLTLPMTYQISVTKQLGNAALTGARMPTGTGTIEIRVLGHGSSGSFTWSMNIVNVYYNETLDAAVFKVS